MTSLPSLEVLLVEELKDLYFAEKELIKALPKMAKAAGNRELKTAFTGHLAETRVHASRLEQALKILGRPPKGKTCHAMLGLVKEGTEAIKIKGPASLRDAMLIGAAQRVEHYEMAGYGTARTFAHLLKKTQVTALLQKTLNEEGAADKKLTKISTTVNRDALATGHNGHRPTSSS